MSDAPTLSPEVSRSVLALARAPRVAARSWALHLHPVDDGQQQGAMQPPASTPLKYM